MGLGMEWAQRCVELFERCHLTIWSHALPPGLSFQGSLCVLLQNDPPLSQPASAFLWDMAHGPAFADNNLELTSDKGSLVLVLRGLWRDKALPKVTLTTLS